MKIKTNNHPLFLDIINQLPAMIYYTDINANFIHANEVTAKWFGYKKADDIRGITYYDMRCKAVEHADYFVQQTKKVVETQKPLKIVAYYCYANGDWKLLLGEKSLIADKNNQTVGCASYFQEVTNYNLISLSMLLLKADAEHISSHKTKQVNYIVEASYPNIGLTKRESECLFFLLRGKSAKETAYILNLSARTIEEHIEKIKTKLDCRSKSSLIEKAINQGFMGIIPDSVLMKHLMRFL